MLCYIILYQTKIKMIQKINTKKTNTKNTNTKKTKKKNINFM